MAGVTFTYETAVSIRASGRFIKFVDGGDRTRVPLLMCKVVLFPCRSGGTLIRSGRGLKSKRRDHLLCRMVPASSKSV